MKTFCPNVGELNNSEGFVVLILTSTFSSLFNYLKGSIRFGSYCYKVGDETKTFDEAKRICLDAGSNLVDVSDRYTFP